MICNDCGWVCGCVLFHTLGCWDKHELHHKEIEAERDAHIDDTGSYLTHYEETTASQSIFGQRKIKRCQSCEDEVGVTNHACKKLKTSIDFIDLLLLIDKKKLNDLRKKD